MPISSGLYKTADLIIDVKTQQVFQNKKHLSLSELSYKTLLNLIKAAPESLTSNQLIDGVWGDVIVSPETVTQRIALLRKALAKESSIEHDYIGSVRNKGYRWIPEVSIGKPGNQRLMLKVLASLFSIIFVIITWHFSSNPNSGANNQNIQSPKLTATDLTHQALKYLDKHNSQSVELAEGLFRKALLLDPNNVSALTGLSIALSHQVTKFNHSNSSLNEARDLAELAISMAPNKAAPWAALAFVDDASGQIDQAIIGYEKAMSLATDNGSVKSSLAYLYAQKGRLVDALRLNIEVLGTEQFYLNLQIAEVLELLGFDMVAEQWYLKADSLSPDNVFAAQMRSQFYLASNQIQLAQSILQDAINRGVSRPELYVTLGLIEWIRGDLKMAVIHFEHAVSIDTEDMHAQVWLFLVKHEIGSVSRSDVNNAETKWLNGDITWPDQWVYKALVLAQFNRLEEAIIELHLAYKAGFRNHRLLEQFPPFKKMMDLPEWSELLESMQSDVNNQRHQLLKSDWLPTSFLDPQ